MLWSLQYPWGLPSLLANNEKPRKEIIHNMALIDEYKQAIQDVLDGRAKEAPRPSELPWTEDKAATMWAAAAAELIAEDSAGGGGADEFVITFASATDGTESDVTQNEIYEAATAGKQMVLMVAGVREPVLKYAFGSGGPAKWCEQISSESFKTSQATKGSSSKVTLSSRPSGAFIVNDVSGTLNKTHSEIYTAFMSDGQPVLIYGGTYPNSYHVSVVACYYEYGTGYVVATNGAGPIAETYIATHQSDYPVAQS